jgi:hypothetical protein
MSLPVSLPTPASAGPEPVVSPPRDCPGSPGCRTPIRIFKALGSMPTPSSRPLAASLPRGSRSPLRPQARPAGPRSPPVGKTLQPLELRAMSRGAASHSLPLGSRALCLQPRTPHSMGEADRASTVASHGPCPTSPSASCPRRSGSRLGCAPSCSQTPGTAAASRTVALDRHPWRVFHC